jgi:hypothetical protein
MLDKLSNSPDLSMLQCEHFITDFEEQLLSYSGFGEDLQPAPWIAFVSNWLPVVHAHQEVPATSYETALAYQLVKCPFLYTGNCPY